MRRWTLVLAVVLQAAVLYGISRTTTELLDNTQKAR
jgi:hypothetical protein